MPFSELSWARDLLHIVITDTSDPNSWPLVLAFIGLHALAASLFVPCSPFAVIAGGLWGILLGLPISIAASLIAMSTTFALGRAARSVPSIRNLLGKYLPQELLQRLSPRLNWGLVLAIQLNPLVPASSAGYAFGLSGVPFPTFIGMSALAILPMQMILVIISAAGVDALRGKEISGYAFAALLCASGALAALTYIKYKRSRQLAEKDEANVCRD